jgi:hypothetical protein
VGPGQLLFILECVILEILEMILEILLGWSIKGYVDRTIGPV